MTGHCTLSCIKSCSYAGSLNHCSHAVPFWLACSRTLPHLDDNYTRMAASGNSCSAAYDSSQCFCRYNHKMLELVKHVLLAITTLQIREDRFQVISRPSPKTISSLKAKYPELSDMSSIFPSHILARSLDFDNFHDFEQLCLAAAEAGHSLCNWLK